jgi:hypothetical protein
MMLSSVHAQSKVGLGLPCLGTGQLMFLTSQRGVTCRCCVQDPACLPHSSAAAACASY